MAGAACGPLRDVRAGPGWAGALPLDSAAGLAQGNSCSTLGCRLTVWLPDSMTTWEIHGVSLSQSKGERPSPSSWLSAQCLLGRTVPGARRLCLTWSRAGTVRAPHPL